jgi:hypothetical protein
VKNLVTLIILVLVFSCSNQKKQQSITEMKNFEKGTYGYDVKFLNEYLEPVELVQGESRILLSPKYQGRVMTSSSDGLGGNSYGWINHELIKSGEVLEQINPVGGEERFWLGPEGGQYSIFFEPGVSFDFENWATPAVLDTEPFQVNKQTETEVEFFKNIELRNYSNYNFIFDVNRIVRLLNREEIERQLGIKLYDEMRLVGYESINQIKNKGEKAWEKETGLLSIWLLGMFNPSPSVTVIIPYKTEVESDYIVKDDYFGKIPDDRLIVKEGMIYFKGDGKERGKLGVPPQRALPVLGSYDAENNILTVVRTMIPEGETDYVNSAWELQENPYYGDALNSYNDGPLDDGSQLGPFYELETSSPALALKPGEQAVHSQSTVHFEGTEEQLNAICQQIFDITLKEVKSAFD